MVDAGALKLGALFYGENNAETVVLLHGWADSAWSMDSVAQPLAANHQVVSLDLRGHGVSERGPYNMIHFIGDLRGVFESLQLDAPIIMGHSLGGQASAQFCGLYPGLPRALVMIEGLGPPPHRLADTDPDELERNSALRQVERVRYPARTRSIPSLDAAIERLSSAHPLLDRARAAFLAEQNSVEGEAGERYWRHDPATRDWLNGHSGELAAARWRGIGCPVLAVNGGDSYERYWRPHRDSPDEYPAPLAGQALQDRLSNFADVRYAEIAGAGHMLPYDKPDELNRVIAEFITTLKPIDS